MYPENCALNAQMAAAEDTTKLGLALFWAIKNGAEENGW